jgi:uncharacterized protein (TIGR02452 family)
VAKRTTRAQTAQETLTILQQGRYTSQGGKPVHLRDELNSALARSALFTPEQLEKLLQTSHPLPQDPGAESPPTAFEVVNETTLHAAHRLHREGVGRVLALNFASARHPGGGFLKGSQAQEESLARASGLYPCIAQFTAMYETNQHFPSCLYTDHMIYAPDVPVFRDDDDRLLEEPYPVSFVTAPAVNAGAVHHNEPENVGRIEPVMKARLEKVLALAVHCGHDVLVLGAWGCGVFRNDPAAVAGWFAQLLRGQGAFRSAFRRVTFAVLDRNGDGATIGAFAQLFG